jgi:hypothetical protein
MQGVQTRRLLSGKVHVTVQPLAKQEMQQGKTAARRSIFVRLSKAMVQKLWSKSCGPKAVRSFFLALRTPSLALGVGVVGWEALGWSWLWSATWYSVFLVLGEHLGHSPDCPPEPSHSG